MTRRGALQHCAARSLSRDSARPVPEIHADLRLPVSGQRTFSHWSGCCSLGAPMKLPSLIGWALLVAGCASQSARFAPAALPATAQATPCPNSVASVAPRIETSHVYLLSPGKDAVRIVVSR